MQPDDATLRKIEEHAVELAKGAGRILEAHFGKALDVEFKAKDKTDPVSQADKESEEYLKEAIRSRFPDHAVLGEEGTDEGSDSSDFLWALDPLDGTVNYINGLPIYSVSIGVLYRGAPVVGCIWVPFPDKDRSAIYHARLGHGAYRNGKAISVRKNPSPQPGQLAIFPREYLWEYLRKAGRNAPVGEVRDSGSISYEMALTSSGVLQYAFFASPSLWDVAAGVVLVREAGGTALVYDRRRSVWTDLLYFPSLGSGGGLAELRRWHAPILVGNGELVEYLAQFLRPGWFKRFIGRLGLR